MTDKSKNSSVGVKSKSTANENKCRLIEIKLQEEWKMEVDKLLKQYIEKHHQEILMKYQNKSIDLLTEEYVVPEEFMFGITNPFMEKDMGWLTHGIPTNLMKFALACGIFYVNSSGEEKNKSIHHPSFALLKGLQSAFELDEAKKKVGVLFVGEELTVGINLPIKTVIIYDPEGNFSQSQIEQASGRAGRAGIDQFGIVNLLTKDSDERAIQEPVNLLIK